MSQNYQFLDNTIYKRGFTWAYSIIPKSEMFEINCPKCGIRGRYPSGAFDVVVEGGSKFPDVLGCGAYPLLIVSEEVITDWKNAGIKSFDTYPVGIAEVQSKKLQDVQPPKYFRVEITGNCKIDLEKSGFHLLKKCSECGHTHFEGRATSGFQMVPGSWDGSPVFRDFDVFPRVTFCTELIVELAREQKRTNFRFVLMDEPEDASNKGLDYLK